MVQLSPPTDWVQHWTSNSISFGLITKLSRFYYGTTIMEPAGVQVHGASPSCGVSDWWLGYNIWIFVSHEVIITVLCQHIPHIFALVLTEFSWQGEAIGNPTSWWLSSGRCANQIHRHGIPS
jgi:hypothetical protein